MSIVDEMNIVLTDNIIDYCMSMYADTRLSIDIKKQFTDMPVGMDAAISFMRENSSILYRSIQMYNDNAQAVAREIDKLTDPLRRIALWGSYVKTYGR